MKRTIIGIMTIVALGASAPVAQAQRPMTFGIAAGASFPTGDLGDALETGFHGMATLGLMPAMVPFGVRIDGMYNGFGAKDSDVNARIFGLSANGVFAIPSTVTSPYIIGGLGWYNSDDDDQFAGVESEAVNNFGLNVGVGMKFNLSGFGTFAEVRYHHVMQSDDEGGSFQFIPLTFGIMF